MAQPIAFVDLSTVIETDVEPARVFERVMERENRKHADARPELDDTGDCLDIGADIALTEHDRLGHTGRTGGKQQGHQGIRIDRGL